MHNWSYYDGTLSPGHHALLASVNSFATDRFKGENAAKFLRNQRMVRKMNSPTNIARLVRSILAH